MKRRFKFFWLTLIALFISTSPIHALAQEHPFTPFADEEHMPNAAQRDAWEDFLSIHENYEIKDLLVLEEDGTEGTDLDEITASFNPEAEHSILSSGTPEQETHYYLYGTEDENAKLMLHYYQGSLVVLGVYNGTHIASPSLFVDMEEVMSLQETEAGFDDILALNPITTAFVEMTRDDMPVYQYITFAGEDVENGYGMHFLVIDEQIVAIDGMTLGAALVETYEQLSMDFFNLYFESIE